MFGRFENPGRGMQARNLTTNVSKILDLKSSSEQIFSKNCRWVPLMKRIAKNIILEEGINYTANRNGGTYGQT